MVEGGPGAAGAPTVGGEQEIGSVLLGQPSDLVDLLLNLQALQVIELGLMALEGAVDIVLSPAVGLVLALHGDRDREQLRLLAAGSGCSGAGDSQSGANCPGTASADTTALSAQWGWTGNGAETEREWSGNREGMERECSRNRSHPTLCPWGMAGSQCQLPPGADPSHRRAAGSSYRYRMGSLGLGGWVGEAPHVPLSRS